jgi:hypothetical protein
MEYVAQDFEQLLINPYDHKIGSDLMKVFPILSKYKEFRVKLPSQIKREYVLRYIIYAFDRNSPLIAITDIMERRVEAANMAGFPVNDNGTFGILVDKMIRSLNPVINHMVIRYCMLLGDTDYTVLITYEDSLLRELERLITFDSDSEKEGSENKKSLIANISTLRLTINSLKDDFLAKNVDYFLSRSLSEFSESKKVDLSPEYYAKELKGWDNVSRYYERVNK